LWFTISLRLGKIYLDINKYQELDNLLTVLKKSCENKDEENGYESSKANLLLETFALEIQMCVNTKDTKRMQKVYPQTVTLNSVINDPRVLGVIKDCGGQMFAS
jgi:COP9 signalosome complex subunit 2